MPALKGQKVTFGHVRLMLFVAIELYEGEASHCFIHHCQNQIAATGVHTSFHMTSAFFVPTTTQQSSPTL